ncbi:MAG: acetate--CoA ligase family protein [Chloroflexota bacterium]|nr:acetate--CoA ligase family protein [Chloroflexota bacterium]
MDKLHRAFFIPQSVAIIGASSDPRKLSYAVLDNLTRYGYPGSVYPINPKGGAILGLKVYPSVLDVPDDIDLAVIVIPAPQVASALEQCGQKGVNGVVVITAGFREVGGDGMKLERALIDITKKYSMRMIGPNCIGIIDTVIPLNISFAAGMPKRGNIAFMTQSGALAQAVLDWAEGQGIGFSRFVSIGNKADCNENDFIDAWGDDESSKVILAYLEDIRDGAEFMARAQRVGRDKRTPIIAIKSGVTEAGTRAISSHTGSLAGSERAYDAAFKQAGVVRANSIESLFDYSIAFAYQPLLRGNRIAVVTNAGGMGVMATDAIERAGMKMARLAPETIRALLSAAPQIASALNPIDVRGDAFEDRYEIALRHALADPNVDAAIAILIPQELTPVKKSARVIAQVAKEFEAQEKTTIGCFMGEARSREGVQILIENSVPNYTFPERAVDALRAMWEHRQWLERPVEAPPQFEIDRAKIRATIDAVRADHRTALVESEARAIAQAIGLRVPQTELARNADEAIAVAQRIGYPVVLKIASPDILHKSDIGGVKVGIANDADARDAFDLITYRAQRFMPDAQIWGVTVQQMIPAGKEVIIGMSRDPQFGPLLAFGLGGIYVEVLKDVTFRIAPITARDADEMMSEIRGAPLLRGVRGEAPSDLAAVRDALLRVSQLVSEFPEIVELDVNPLVVHASGAVALDVRMVIA